MTEAEKIQLFLKRLQLVEDDIDKVMSAVEEAIAILLECKVCRAGWAAGGAGVATRCIRGIQKHHALGRMSRGGIQ